MLYNTVCVEFRVKISSGDIGGLIVFSDQAIDDYIGTTYTEPVPTRIQRLSALLTSIRIYSHSDLHSS